MHRQPTMLTVSVASASIRLPIATGKFRRITWPKFAGGRKLMMEAAVDNEERLAARLLAVDDAGHVYAALADDVATQLDHDACVRQVRADPVHHQAGEVVPDGREVERSVTLEIRDAEAAPEVQVADWHGGVLRQSQRELDSLELCLAQALHVQVLGAGEDVKPEKLELRRSELTEQCRHLLGVDAELLGAPAHAHA